MAMNSPIIFNHRSRPYHNNGADKTYNFNVGMRNGRLNYSSPIFDSGLSLSDTSTSSRSNKSDDVNPTVFLSEGKNFYMSPPHHTRPKTSYQPIRFEHSPATSLGNSLDLSNLSKFLDASIDGSTYSDANRPAVRTTLPNYALDSQGHIILSFAEILEKGLVNTFARDKLGCHYLQETYPSQDDFEVRRALADLVLKKEEVFESLCADVFGNFFIQRVIEKSNQEEQRWISSRLTNNMFQLCLNRYSCRVVQKAIEGLHIELKGVLLLELHTCDLVRLSTDQNANHVIQKIMNSFPLNHWNFIVERFIVDLSALFSVAKNKYGCRVIQLSIELLSKTKAEKPGLAENADRLLTGLMNHLMNNCEELASNEFANYVIQHVLESAPLAEYRDVIIDKCLLRNLLSMSQEKYASHVVEKALEFAPPHLLKEMMEEIFDGYVPHPETKKDALDIMIFHQYGNYVIQRMLDTCVAAARAKRNHIELTDTDLRLIWLKKMEERINLNRGRLAKYSSGKKILDTLEKLGNPHNMSHFKRENLNNAIILSVPSVPQGFR